jgi:trk system potassium uptake protein TrkA
MLDESGDDVTVVDTDSRAFRRLPASFGGDTVIGTGIDEDVLRRAGIEHADAFIAVTNGDNRNIMASQVARLVFNVPGVICRIYDPVRAETYGRLGLTTVCPTTTVASIVIDSIKGVSTENAAPATGMR